MKVYLVTVVLMKGTDFESEYVTNVALTRPVAEAIMDKLVKETQYPLDEYYYIREVEVEDEDSVKESSSKSYNEEIENKRNNPNRSAKLDARTDLLRLRAMLVVDDL